jgi:hypothetical protein
MSDPNELHASKEVTLYVRSHEEITSEKHLSSSETQIVKPITSASSESYKGFQGTPTWNQRRGADIVQRERVLPEDQLRVNYLVENIALKRGYVVKVVDVGDENVLKRFLDTHLKGVTKYPVLLCAHSSRRLEGVDAFTQEALEEILPKQ